MSQRASVFLAVRTAGVLSKVLDVAFTRKMEITKKRKLCRTEGPYLNNGQAPHLFEPHLDGAMELPCPSSSPHFCSPCAMLIEAPEPLHGPSLFWECICTSHPASTQIHLLSGAFPPSLPLLALCSQSIWSIPLSALSIGSLPAFLLYFSMRFSQRLYLI